MKNRVVAKLLKSLIESCANPSVAVTFVSFSGVEEAEPELGCFFCCAFRVAKRPTFSVAKTRPSSQPV